MGRSTLPLSLLLPLLFCACVASDVGDPCTPEQIPAGGFVGSETYLETSTAQCRTRVCLVRHLAGDPTNPCTGAASGDCTFAEDVAQSVYCTCRCDGPPGADYCGCPDGFSCTPLLHGGAAGVRGSYCVRN